MKLLKHPALLALVTVLIIIMAACSQQPNGTSGYGTPSTSITSSSSSLTAATATVNGISKTLLSDAQGKTLYYFTPDNSTKSACLNTCAQTWPPQLGSSFHLPSSFNGTLSVQDGGNGKQAQYNGHFLYTFSGDKGPGDINGEGIGGKWFVVTPDLK